jgi:hypothetical protein
MFTEIYLETTNPTLTLYEMLAPALLSKIAVSVLFHAVIYTIAANLFSLIFLGRALTVSVNTRFIMALVIIMTVGYFGRFYHIKDILKGYGGNMEKTRRHIDQHYNTWVFIA